MKFYAPFFAAFIALTIASSTYAQTNNQSIEDVNIVLYEKTSRLGVMGDVLSALLSKDSTTGTIYIDPFGLNNARSNKLVNLCYVKQNSKALSDDELIATNLKKTLGGDDSLYDKVGSEKVQFNTFGSFEQLGVALIQNKCDYIAAASTETLQIENTIKSVDERTDKTYKPILDFKISSTKLWNKPEPGKPISRAEYLSIAWCGFPDAQDAIALQNFDLKNASSCKDAQKELANEGYANSTEYNAKKIIAYEQDKATGKKSNQTAEQVRVERVRAAELERKKVHSAQYPYYATISCLDRGQEIDIRYCMYGQQESLNGEVKIQTDGRTRLYQHADFEEIPSVVNLTTQFRIIAQNASTYFILEVKVFQSMSGKQVYSDQVGKYGVINIGN